MGAYVIFNPDAKVKIWMGWLWGTLEVSALLVMAVFYIMNLAMSFLAATLGTVTHVGYAAHIAGFLSGLVLAKFMETRQPVITAPSPTWQRVR
jgi:membrane associated rhomboid family serine protease